MRTIVVVPAVAKNRPMSTADFPRVLAAEGVSNFGSMLSRLALPWLATLVLQATAWQMAALLVAGAALGGLLWAGEVDRQAKRTAMLACDAVRALLFGGLAWAAWRGHATMALLVAVAALDGVAGAVFELARSAWIAQRVPHAELPRRNAQLSAAGSLSETVAFALGGWLFQGLGAALALAVDALSFVLSALCLRGVHAAPPPTAGPTATPPPRTLLRALGVETTAGLALLVVHQLVGDGGHVLHDIHDRTLRQTLVPEAQLARADAGIRFAGHRATLVGALAGGAVGEALGERSALLLAVGLFAAAALLAWAGRARFRLA